MIWDIWWAWVAAALVLAMLEVVVPGFIFLGFALGAAVVGFLILAGLAVALAWLLVIFALVSLVAWVVMRRAFGIRRGQVKYWDRDINED